jgi:hypothetical protein
LKTRLFGLLGAVAALLAIVVVTITYFVNVPSPSQGKPVIANRQTALNALRQRLPAVAIDFDERLNLPTDVHCVGTFLTGPNGEGGAVSAKAAQRYAGNVHQAIYAFVDDYAGLFGFEASFIKNAVPERDYINSHNGMRTVVLAQQVDDIPVYGARLLSNITARGELVNIGSGFIPDPEAAIRAGGSQAEPILQNPEASASRALESAIRAI